MVQSGVIQYLQNGFHRASFWVSSSVKEPLETCLDQRSGAHRTGFDGDVELAIEQSVVAEGRSSIAKGNNLGVRARVLISEVAVVSAADYLACTHHQGAYGDLTHGFRFSRFFEREPHELFVRRHSIDCSGCE